MTLTLTPEGFVSGEEGGEVEAVSGDPLLDGKVDNVGEGLGEEKLEVGVTGRLCCFHVS